VHAQDRINAPSSFQGKRGCRGEPLTPSWTTQPPFGSACIRSNGTSSLRYEILASTGPAHKTVWIPRRLNKSKNPGGASNIARRYPVFKEPGPRRINRRFPLPLSAASARFPSVFTPG
jgi:hypothetical protein